MGEDIVANDPRTIIDERPMSAFQWSAVAIMVALNALDGFDVQSIGFASPGITREWGIDRAALGIVLSMELVGMAVGSILLGGVADRIGRRNTILGCLVVLGTGMALASTAHDLTTMSVWRILTGVGIGGMLAATNAAVAEVSNAKWRNFAVVAMAGGYPVGAVVGGMISAELLKHYHWSAVFLVGTAGALILIPIILWRVPESIAFLVHKRPPNALRKINATLKRMDHPTVEALPEAEPPATKVPLAQLFSHEFATRTVLIGLAYMAHIMTFYFLLKWIPKIVDDMGYLPSQAVGVAVWANVGGMAGCVLLGLLTARVRVLWLTAAAMLFSAILVTVFGQGQKDLAGLATIAACAGFFTNAGVVGLYALMAQSFPTGLRATATGLIIGVGRGSSAAAPAIGGWLFVMGYGLPTVAALMALGSAVGLVALLALRVRGAPA